MDHPAKGLRTSARPASSLRTRFVLGLAVVLLPFLAAAFVGWTYLLPALTNPTRALTEEVITELRPLRDLQLSLLTAALAANNYVHNASPAARREMERVGAHVARAFQRAAAIPFEPDERPLIEQARRQWYSAWRTVEQQQSGRGAAPDLEAVGSRIAKAVEALDRLAYRTRGEIDRTGAAVEAARRAALATTGTAFALALAISLIAGSLLARSVLRMTRALAECSARLADGDLSCRLPATRSDELGQVARAFNAMAERIQEVQQALQELATHDSLTELLSRRAFEQRLSEELERSRRYHHPCAVMIIDADHFKRVNDAYGHPVGDEVLRTLAARIREHIRPTDRAGRYGGEEFAVLLPETTTAEAVEVAERIRAGVARAPLAVVDDRPIGVTVSVGVAAYPEDAASEEALVEAADRLLYGGKEAGRDRVLPAPAGR
ncbi:MAG: GGDEF domain-containing protein [Gammaproteobacteria bacterium]